MTVLVTGLSELKSYSSPRYQDERGAKSKRTKAMRAHFTTYRLVLSVTHTAQTVNSKGQVRNRVGMGMEEGTT